MPNDKGFMRGKYARVLTTVLVAQAALFYASSRGENVPGLRPLHDFARDLPGWMTAQEGYVDAETQAVLKADDTLDRSYASPKYEARANLFVAFFKTQRTGKAPHSPKNCLPGSGWEKTTDDYLDVTVPGLAEPIRVNRYIVTKGDTKSLVLYWYQTPNRVIASEYKAKLLTIEDAIRYNRTDMAIVRVVIPVFANNEAAAQQAGVDFVQSFFAPLRQFLPS
jgi:EpsI family protein